MHTKMSAAACSDPPSSLDKVWINPRGPFFDPAGSEPLPFSPAYPAPSTGWLCPRCGGGVAPSMQICPCNSSNPLGPWVPTCAPSNISPLPDYVVTTAGKPAGYEVRHANWELDTDTFLADSKPYSARHGHDEFAATARDPAPPFSVLRDFATGKPVPSPWDGVQGTSYGGTD